ncbi:MULTISPECIES: hypothetical protein [Streptomycetaceae]|uniref:Zinc finger SWIM domain protein n=1 Tax=Streptantibioticus cattleyicolor (strain ATCC 35852 / DSM 46488 / JCM 4925 / NBRC 14057 / NRRL 8057) TaxID=1003195 RepID=F8K071_STREN|nr:MULTISPECIES: hypothetical protein [Streptomycetaceae]AEW96057.1 zinc finger SWIM domain protein [Streptantibioticus cattleyicolor NRRL 8057 = DSM 46488]MYS60587.1 SWIM zinc finger family protein [Streptomyces sp. SID5468]CCB76391.1 conserved protein of unknown function [Streptantibioticus cattleyicolor NRRL 8057 = DSM 46488]
MEETPSRWPVERVLALAPDAASRTVGDRLGKPGPWSGTGWSPPSDDRAPGAGGTVWGRCADGSGPPYETVADLSGPAFHCTCRSREAPCEHALALLSLWARDAGTDVPAAEPPEWVTPWLAARPEPRPAGPRTARADPQAARRRAERRAHRVAAGAAELEQRLADRLRAGLAAPDARDGRVWDEIAARMVDAQAPGLAARVRELAAIPHTGTEWPSRMLEESGLLHLLARGCLRGDALPGPLAATVRSRVGFTVEAAGLLAGRTVRDRWLVLAQHDSGDERLTTRRIWLHGLDGERPALLLSYGARGRPPEVSLPVGAVLDAELAYHPGAIRLRAALGPRHGAPGPGPVPPGIGVEAALDAYGEAVRADPWLEEWPVVLAGVVPVPCETGWQLADAGGAWALPVDRRRIGRPSLWRLPAVSGGDPVTVFGTLGHHGFAPLTTWVAHDPARPEAVAL